MFLSVYFLLVISNVHLRYTDKSKRRNAIRTRVHVQMAQQRCSLRPYIHLFYSLFVFIYVIQCTTLFLYQMMLESLNSNDNGAVTTYTYVAHEFTPVFQWGLCYSLFNISVKCFVNYCLFFIYLRLLITLLVSSIFSYASPKTFLRYCKITCMLKQIFCMISQKRLSCLTRNLPYLI